MKVPPLMGANRMIDSGYSAGINYSTNSDVAYVYIFNPDRTVYKMMGFRWSKCDVFPVNDF